MNVNKILTITAIVLVAVIMGMSAVAPVVLQQAEARPDLLYQQKPVNIYQIYQTHLQQ